MHSLPNFAVLEGESRHKSKQQQSFSASVSTFCKSPDLYFFWTTKVFPTFLLPFESQASFQSEEFGSYMYMYDYAPLPLLLVV